MWSTMSMFQRISGPKAPESLRLQPRFQPWLLLFPTTLYYFSPALILQRAAEGIINASLLVFGLMFLSSLFFGRLWCGWACPAGALQEFGAPINNKRTPGGKFNWVKRFIWPPGLVSSLSWLLAPVVTIAWIPFSSLRAG